MAKLKVTYKKSVIGYAQDQKDTVAALGFKKLGTSIVHDDNPAIRGMIHKVRHLLEVEELD
ncbi:MAG TPA: 50S ribosomal protein L30 [Firmicutes bacterium]|nr:50S ribosomal protein L30 [Bacillota bacterium]